MSSFLAQPVRVSREPSISSSARNARAYCELLRRRTPGMPSASLCSPRSVRTAATSSAWRGVTTAPSSVSNLRAAPTRAPAVAGSVLATTAAAAMSDSATPRWSPILLPQGKRLAVQTGCVRDQSGSPADAAQSPPAIGQVAGSGLGGTTQRPGPMNWSAAVSRSPRARATTPNTHVGQVDRME